MFIILIPMLLCVTLFTLMKAILYFPSLSVTKKKFLFFQIILFTLIIISINFFKIEIDYFQSFIIYLIIFVFNMITYSDELDRYY